MPSNAVCDECGQIGHEGLACPTEWAKFGMTPSCSAPEPEDKESVAWARWARDRNLARALYSEAKGRMARRKTEEAIDRIRQYDPQLAEQKAAAMEPLGPTILEQWKAKHAEDEKNGPEAKAEADASAASKEA